MKTAIIVAFRNRWANLAIFAPAMKAYFPEADIFIIEQGDNKPFNKGALLNCGFTEAKGYDIYIQHDIDNIPIDVDYSPSKNVVHLGTQMEQFGYQMPYKTFFGGVIMLPKKKLWNLNGWSNNFWNHGGEDDEVRKELRRKYIPFESRQCRFKSLPHSRGEGVSDREHPYYNWNVNILNQGRPDGDGLNSVKYALNSITKLPDYTHICVDILHNPPTQSELNNIGNVRWRPDVI